MSEERRFDPTRHFIQLRNRKGSGTQDYLPVAARVAWLRAEHPDAEVDTEMMVHLPDEAIFRARVTIPGKGSATGWGSETRADFPAGHVEKAESKALGRALAVLGFGTLQAGDELDEGEQPVDRPQPAPQRRSSPQPPTQSSKAGAAPPAPPATPYLPSEFERALDGLWAMAEDGKPLDAIKRRVNEHWPRLDPAQREEALAAVAKITAQHYAPAGAAG